MFFVFVFFVVVIVIALSIKNGRGTRIKKPI